MSKYSNLQSVGIAEIARLRFLDDVNGEVREVIEIVMHVEALKNFHRVVGQTIQQHDEAMVKQAEANKGMN